MITRLDLDLIWRFFFLLEELGSFKFLNLLSSLVSYWFKIYH